MERRHRMERSTGTLPTFQSQSGSLTYSRLVCESVEDVLCGWMGVLLIVLIVDVYLDFTIACCYWNAAVLLLSCYSLLREVPFECSE
ncbi:hypothetical protein PC129_g22636 [Phytophthora cactorum]|uniref:Uncharacterized protein n=1 Tax=Phytophthora cactorum TaxID=29920 RepID=A0A329R9V7_9STRA|nr:hypothetical protein PC115_g23535 [Phytophthora cactorum]KAG3048717.1 hypothetical protein PC122_g23753 [Phytophthora cactorum]KAG3204062.1 hypothetical protein PC129_g22636 [Phytophthora cactorum]RAW20068.1 hypothetical protein PC110_g23490 [Phytophthora cactorum]